MELQRKHLLLSHYLACTQITLFEKALKEFFFEAKKKSKMEIPLGLLVLPKLRKIVKYNTFNCENSSIFSLGTADEIGKQHKQDFKH